MNTAAPRQAPGLTRTNGYWNMVLRQRDPPRFYQQLARRYGLPFRALARGAACALRYDNPADPEAVWIQQRIAEKLKPFIIMGRGTAMGQRLIQPFRALKFVSQRRTQTGVWRIDHVMFNSASAE